MEVAGAGATIPLPGFGHTLVKGMMEDAAQWGLFGILTGGFKAVSAGLLSAVLFGYLMSSCSAPKAERAGTEGVRDLHGAAEKPPGF